MQHDHVSACVQHPLPVKGGMLASGKNPLFWVFFPNLMDESFHPIRIVGVSTRHTNKGVALVHHLEENLFMPETEILHIDLMPYLAGRMEAQQAQGREGGKRDITGRLDQNAFHRPNAQMRVT